jgi:aerobic carbon-monoxide dehydrogenase small subunit
MNIKLQINRETIEAAVEAGDNLLDTLRELGYTGVKRGCGEGTCGSCAVLVDGRLALSCVTFSAAMQGRKITTIEGLGSVDDPHAIQMEFVKAGAVQCGFCTPGMILATKALLNVNPQPTSDDIKLALDGNRCRCTGYVKILEAVENAAALLRDSQAGEG